MRGLLFLALMLTGALVALTGLRQFFIEPLADASVNLVWFLIQVAPLLLTLPGLLRLSIKSTFVLSMTSLLYFIHGVLIVFDPGMQLLGAFEIGFALSLCGVASWMVRSLREQEAARPPAES